MFDNCIGNCLKCMRCVRQNFQILGNFETVAEDIEQRDGYGIAIDIGTTSVVLSLLDMSTGKLIAQHSFLNPQRKYGVDVITRISAANGGKLQELRSMIANSILSGVYDLIKSCGVPPKSLIDITIAGNTVMIYLLLGIPCESLGISPFKPTYSLKSHYDFCELFGVVDIKCPIRVIPWIAAFVGGDITSGLLCVMPIGKSPFLLIDLGTNGEIALFHNNKLVVTATAAGPAFEGGKHECGASGVIDKLAGLLRDGHVDETGLLSEDAPPIFSQKDVRDLQLAKSAIRSGIEILLESAKLKYSGLSAVYLAGGIGQALNLDYAVEVGILPMSLRNKAYAVGNTSIGGAVRMLLAPENTKKDMDKLFSCKCEINLAGHPLFNEYFMEHMYFEVDNYGFS